MVRGLEDEDLTRPGSCPAFGRPLVSYPTLSPARSPTSNPPSRSAGEVGDWKVAPDDASTQAEECQHRHHYHDQTDQVDHVIHFGLPVRDAPAR